MFGLGILLRHLLPDTALATYTYILVSYHLVLAFKVLTADKEAGLSLPWSQTILTHLACVGLLIGLAMGRHTIPFFGLIRYFMPGLAPFEANWLFNGEKKKALRPTDPEAIEAARLALALQQSEAAVAPPTASSPAVAPGVAAAIAASTTGVPSLAYTSSGADYEEFLKLMQQGNRPFRRPGVSVTQEYELWLAHRAKSRSTAAQSSVRA
jgi:hypothetical protein